MIPRITLKQFKHTFSSKDYDAVACAQFLDHDTTSVIAEQAGKYLSTAAMVIDGKAGAAYERLTSAYVGCTKFGKQQMDLSILESKIFELAEGYTSYACCFSVVRLNPLGGMTSHRDYSYNRYLLGTLVLEGKLLFGVGSSREAAYCDNTILTPGDFIALYAPREKITDRRPYFWACAIEPDKPTLAIRAWLRECKSCLG